MAFAIQMRPDVTLETAREDSRDFWTKLDSPLTGALTLRWTPRFGESLRSGPHHRV